MCRYGLVGTGGWVDPNISEQAFHDRKTSVSRRQHYGKVVIGGWVDLCILKQVFDGIHVSLYRCLLKPPFVHNAIH